MISKFINFFKGYLIIHAKGSFLERFLNLCLFSNILLYDLSRQDSENLSAKIHISSFQKLRPIARKTRTKIRINERYGFPFFIKKHIKRRGIFLGVILAAVIIYFFSTHLMGITFSGNKKISEEDLLSSLSSYGIEIGVPLKDIDTKILKNQLMTSNPDLGWIGLSLKGSRLYIEVKERTHRTDIPGTDEPCNLVASKNGVVRLMEIRDGQTMVLVNTPVKKGDLLVSGVIDSNSVGMRYVHSYGEVYATTWYKEEMEVPLKYKTKLFTKEKTSKNCLEFLNFSLPLYFSDKSPYQHYETYQTSKDYSLPLKIFPSLKINKTEYLQQTIKTKERTEDEAVLLGKFHLLNKINTKLSPNATIDNIDISHKTSGNIVTVTLECECTENIAVKAPLNK